MYNILIKLLFHTKYIFHILISIYITHYIIYIISRKTILISYFIQIQKQNIL